MVHQTFFVVGLLLQSTLSLHCVFIHGAGEETTDYKIIEGGPREQCTKHFCYWGDIHKYTPQCESHVMIHANTVEMGWDDPRLQDLACRASIRMSNSTDSNGIPLATNSAIFTHSMGNNIFAAALMNKRCGLGDNAFWFAVSGPWRGTPAASSLSEYCSGSTILNAAEREIADLLHYCVDKRTSNAYKSLHANYPGMRDILDYARGKVSGGMCGQSPWGVTSEYSPALEAIQELLKVPRPNDGMVVVDSCEAIAPPGTTWNTKKPDRWYLGKMNHADMTCRNGNAELEIHHDAEPCNWYTTIMDWATSQVL